jgi:uncharacterized protein (UPF0332 family)
MKEFRFMAFDKKLSEHRLQTAEECLNAAKMLFDSKNYDAATNRAYYCIFHCMRSVLAFDCVDFKKHSSVISYFREKFVKTKIFDNRLSDIISDLFELRGKSDYEDFFVPPAEEVCEQIENAEYFLEQVKTYLSK